MSDLTDAAKKSGYMTLNEGDSSYHFLFDENPSLSLIINYERLIQDVNKKTCEILGYKKTDLVGKDPLDIVHASTRMRISNIIDQLFNKEKVIEIEADIITSSGAVRKILFAPGRLVEYNKNFAVLVSGNDITETKKTLREFEENHELFTKFMNLIPAGIFLRDEQGSFIFRNKYISDNYDPEIINTLYPDDETSGLSVSRFMSIKDRKSQDHYCEITTFKFTRQSLTNYTGGIIVDLTDRIESEKAKRETEILFRKVFENSGIGIVLTNMEGDIVEVNPHFTSLSGYSADDLRKKNICEIIFPDDLTGLFNSKDISSQAQRRVVTKNNSIIWTRYSNSVIPNNTGEPQYILNLVENITEDKAIRETLSSYEKRSKAMLSALPDLIFVIDKDGYYLDYSSGSNKDLAVEKEKILGINLRNVFPPQTASGIMMKIKNCIDTGMQDSIEYSLDIDGDTRYFEARIVKYDDKSIFSVVRNITDVKNKELQLKKYADELAQLNASKDRLFSIIAHDLRSPFHALLGLSELLANDINDMTTEEVKKIAKELHVAFKNEYTLLENLLSWSLIQKEKIIVTEEIIDLHKEITETIQLLSWLGARKKINIVNKIPRDVTIKSDVNLFHSVIQNLLSNAIKFSPEESSVTVSYKETNGVCAVEVRDEGMGMSEEEVLRVLARDATYSKPGTAQEKGTGLGLIICRDFIEKLGGRLYILSNKGSGTTVGFTIKN